jgi:hypothetical protein
MTTPAGPKPGGERRGGPAPFSSEWLTSPPPPARPRRFGFDPRWVPDVAPGWFPSERVLSAAVVLMLVCATAFAAGGGSGDRLSARADEPTAGSDGQTALAAVGGQSGTLPDEVNGAGGEDATSTSTAESLVADSASETDDVTPTPTPLVTAEVNLDQSTQVASPDGALLPQYRILTYYGQPHAETMGILGEYGVNDDLDGLRDALQEQADAYERVDPTRPVKIAFEIIATVAQQDAKADGSWLLDTDAETIDEYVDYAAEHDMLVFLDVQIGRRGVPAEIDRIRQWLEQPHVHLALDPEFSMDEGEIPGENYGHIDASDVLYAQQYLANLSAELGIPPKVLIVHQFEWGMITNKDSVAPYPGVQLVIDMDGHGPPAMKLDTYGVMNTQQPIEFNGIKLFYKFDQPILSPEEVLSLDPVPDLIIYQ